jgi:uncharacterized membrane protein
MAVGPESGPLAELAVALVRRQWQLGRADALDRGSAVEFIYHPGPYSLIVAVLARAAGMLSVISRRPSALIGVFISVTTVPAAGYVAVALVLGEHEKAAGSALQLFLNLLGIVVSAVAVLVFYRLITKGLPWDAALRLRRMAAHSRR